MRISDWSSDVCSSDLRVIVGDLDVQPFGRHMLDGADHEGDALVESRHPIVEPRESFRRVFLSGFRLWCFRRQLLFVHVIFSWLMTDTHVAAEDRKSVG